MAEPLKVLLVDDEERVLLLLLSPLIGNKMVLGTLNSSTIFGITLTDPLAFLEVMLATKRFALTMIPGTIVVLGIYLLLGKAYCSWVCPVGLIVELTGEIRDKIRRKMRGKTSGKMEREKSVGGKIQERLGGERVRTKNIKIDEENHRNENDKKETLSTTSGRQYYWSIFVVLILVALTGLPLFQILSPAALLLRGVLFGIGLEIMLIVFIIAIELVGLYKGSGRLWCRIFCPLGAFYALVGRYSPIPFG